MYKITDWQKYQKILQDKPVLVPILENESETENTIEEITNNMLEAYTIVTREKVKDLNPLKLPQYLKIKIREKNRIRRMYQRTRDPFLKQLHNTYTKNVKQEIKDFQNLRFENWIRDANDVDDTIYDVYKKMSNKYSIIPTIHSRHRGLLYFDDEKAQEFFEELEMQFSPNLNCTYEHERRIQRVVNDYFDNAVVVEWL